ncbi:hypothetical protein QTN94_18515 [Vibrio sp. M250220]
MKMTRKSLLAIALMAAPTFALADATATFTWSGTVPKVDEVSTDYKIVNVGSTEFNSGMLGFSNSTSNGITIETASRMQFTVKKTDDTDVGSYKYKVEKVELQKTGGFMEETTDITVTGDGQDLTVGTAVAGVLSGTNISLKTGEDISSIGLAEGDDVLVQATILVTDADVTLTTP